MRVVLGLDVQLGAKRLPCTRKKGCLFLMHTMEFSGPVAAWSLVEDVVEIGPQAACPFLACLLALSCQPRRIGG